jgi:hypothetical protein
MAAAFDESVEKLQDFCNLLGRTRAAVLAEGEVLEARSESLDDTEDEARKRCGSVAERLTSALEDFTQALEDAEEQADRLGQTADDLASSRLSGAQESVPSAESSFETRAAADESALEQELLELFDAGFASLATAVDDIEADVARADGRAREAFGHLADGIDEVGRLTEQLRARSAAALEEAERAVVEGGTSALEREVTGQEGFWRDELPEAVRAECAAVGEPLEALYGDWEAEVTAEGDELSEAVADLLQDAASAVTQQAGEALAAALAEAVDVALTALAGAQEALVSTLSDTEPASEAAAALVDDLAIASRVVDEIDRLLKALAE